MNLTLRVVASGLKRPAQRLRYGEHRDQVAELFLPAGEPLGVVATLHGGWWQARRTRTKLYTAAEGGVDAVVALAAPSDLETRPGPETIALMGGAPDEVPDRYALGSPIRRLPLGVPTLLVHGAADETVPPRRSRDFATAARAAGDDVTLIEPAADHRQVADPRHPAWAPVPLWLAARLE
jgi:fermentation-respiration switch protein FrsA (DUF1100 family)